MCDQCSEGSTERIPLDELAKRAMEAISRVDRPECFDDQDEEDDWHGCRSSAKYHVEKFVEALNNFDIEEI